MRTQYHTQVRDDFVESFPTILSVRRFSPTDIYYFLQNWPFPADGRHNANRIYSELTDRPTLREMCSNPLVLAMYVARDQGAADAVAPESRTEFYKSVSDELIYRRRALSAPSKKIAQRTRDDWKRFLAEISLSHLLDESQSANCLQWSDVISHAEQSFSCSSDDAESIVRDISRYTGLITEERGSETIRFMHLTFCEFFAAWGTVNLSDGGWRNLIEAHVRLSLDGAKTRLAEVMPFALRQLPDYQRQSALSDILKFGDNYLTLYCFLECKNYEHLQWNEFVENLLNDVVNDAAAIDEVEWLDLLHLASVVLSDAEHSLGDKLGQRVVRQREEFHSKLLARRGGALLKLLEELAKSDAVAALRLARHYNLHIRGMYELVISNADQGPFISMVLQIIEEEERNYVLFWAFVFVEASLRSPAALWNLKYKDPVSAFEQYILSNMIFRYKEPLFFYRGVLEQSFAIAAFYWRRVDLRVGVKTINFDDFKLANSFVEHCQPVRYARFAQFFVAPMLGLLGLILSVLSLTKCPSAVCIADPALLSTFAVPLLIMAFLASFVPEYSKAAINMCMHSGTRYWDQFQPWGAHWLLFNNMLVARVLRRVLGLKGCSDYLAFRHTHLVDSGASSEIGLEHQATDVV